MVARSGQQGRAGVAAGEMADAASPRLRLGHAPARVRARAWAGANARRQRGSLALIAVVGILVALAALGVLDLANLYLAKRSLQNVADLAALAAAQQMDDQCTQPTLTATANAASNGFVANGGTRTLSTKCGRWDSNGNGGMTFVENGATPPLNGVWVHVTNYVPYFFIGKGQSIEATATAKATVVGSFQLGTTLVQADLLNGLLGSLLGTSVKLSLVSWNGIANANVTLGQLARIATSAGTVKGLLNTSASVSGLAQLMASGLQSGGSVVSADVAASIAGLNALASATALSNVKIPIADGSSPGLLSLGLADAESAANVSVNALQALIVAAEIAQQGKPPVQVGLNLANLPVVSSLLPASAQLQVNVLSPPSLAVGEAGQTGSPPDWRTYAHNAQVTVQLNVGLSVAGLVNVNLPLYVEAAQASAWLESAQCAPTAAQSRAVIGVQTGIAYLCLGTPPTTAAAMSAANNANSCGGSAAPVADVSAGNLLSFLGLGNLLGLGSIKLVELDANLSALLANPTTAELTFDGTGCPVDSTGSCNWSANTSVGTDVVGALGGALSSVSKQLSAGALSVNVAGLTLTSDELGTLGSAITNALSPLLSTLEQYLLGPLLQLLGVQLGVATVTAQPLSCGVATLVQ